ncbi:3D domain-containing protein [Gracilibacillus massiliensis]|uniref:3D domain-containing protein n=1 Tax=Gracilibacillus massiliensis TaxID=1564956 RepID=UPI00071CD58F|nr:3D domain-containing protein [Gracilibacillus massiliensis]
MRKFLVSMGFVATSFFIVLPLSAAEYEVEKGDSLWKIAEEHNTSVAELKEINKLDSEVIQPKQILEIDKEITYIVERGDSLSRIAEEHNVTVDEIKEWNNLETDLIIIGEKLTIKEVEEDQSESNQEAEETSNQEETPEASEPKVEKKEAEESTKTKEENNKEAKEASSSQDGETITVSATAYTAKCEGCSGITATGINLLENPNMKLIAVDPNVIPLGTRVHVEGYGEAIAGDTGGAINGNKIDLHVPTKDEAYAWGRRTVDVTILD